MCSLACYVMVNVSFFNRSCIYLSFNKYLRPLLDASIGANMNLLDTCRVKKKNHKHTSSVCAGCGEKNPEYVLDERHLCFDCYKAERYYWAKSQ